jgi:serine protease Do
MKWTMFVWIALLGVVILPADGVDAQQVDDAANEKPREAETETALEPSEAESLLDEIEVDPESRSADETAGTGEESDSRDTATMVNPNLFGKAIDYAQRRCVKIYGAGIAKEHGYATGIIVSDSGLVLTAFGLYVSGERPIRVVMPDGKEHLAQVVRRSDRIQTVLLQLKDGDGVTDVKTTEYFEVPASAEVVARGDWVIAIGNPFKVATDDEPLSANLGVVSMRADVDTKKKAQDQDIGADILMIDAITSNPGAPGGALVTVDGRLAGMVGKVIESASTNTRINYAIPSDILRKFLDDELLEEPVDTEQSNKKPFIGLRLFELPGNRAQAYIDRVRRRSPAAKAGLQRDDLILAIGDVQVYSIRDYEELFPKLVPGEEVPFVIKRKDEILVVNVTPEEADEDE